MFKLHFFRFFFVFRVSCFVLLSVFVFSISLFFTLIFFFFLCSPLAAWTCGWFNLIGNAAGDASYAMGFGSAVAATVVGGKGCAIAKNR
jgi:hypothetical protein